MARTIPGDGDVPCDLMLISERLGWEEARAHRLGVGPPGIELWHRLELADAPDRNQWYYTKFIKTYSENAPAPSELLLAGAAMRREIARVQPKLIVSAGAAVTRWLLGRNTDQDTVHGLVHYSKRVQCHVLPIVHPAAALRQPAQYMSALVDDCAAVARAANGVLWGGMLDTYEAAPPVFRDRDIMWRDAIIGCDTEGYVEAPECISFAHDGCAFVAYPDTGKALTHLQKALWKGTPSFHNAPHDLRVLEAMDFDIRDFHDTMLMAFLLDEHVQGLKPLAYRHCNLKLDDYDSLIAPLDDERVQQALEAYVHRHAGALRRIERLKGKRKAEAKRAIPKAVGAVTRLLANPNDEALRTRWSRSVFAEAVPLPKPTTWADLLRDVGEHYAKADAVAHEALCHAFLPRLRELKLERAYEIDKAALPMVARMETVGVQVDVPSLVALSEELASDYARIEQEIESLLGEKLNPKASGDVSEMLFDRLGVTPTRLTKSGAHYTTEDKYLKARKGEHGVIQLILDGRETWKMKAAYCERLPHLVSRDSRYHPDFAYTRTASGRLAETILLLIPKHSLRGWGKKIRSCFVAGLGRVLVSVDLSQIELRVLADNSQDEPFLDVYRAGGDVHADTAHRMLGAPKDKKDQDESLHRLPSKTLNFGIIMGMTEFGLLDQLHSHGLLHWQIDELTDDDRAEGKLSTREFRAEWFHGHPGVKAYVEKKKREARRTGAVRDMWGARTRLDAIDCTDERRVREAERQAHAIPIQAGADRISKQWMARVWREVVLPARGKFYCEPWCRAHDDLILEVAEERADEVKRQMIALVPQVLCVPVLAEGKVGGDWGALKG